MADFNGFQIGIGADVTVLEIQLQKAQNLLKQFEAAAKKATDIGEINYLNTQIKGLNGTISTLHQEMNKVGRPAGDATQSLINFSRIAQDAPYGIIGIANNLNPMLESFERLSKTEGGTKKALQAMVSGLVGPAGIGVALGVVSSLAVSFSKEISDFFAGPTSKLKEFNEELKKINTDLYKIVGVATTNLTTGRGLVDVITGGENIEVKKRALDMLKTLYKDNQDIKDATINSDKTYLNHLVNVAAKQEEYTNKLKNNVEAQNSINTEIGKLTDERDKKLAAITKPKLLSVDQYGVSSYASIKSQQKVINDAYDGLIDSLKAKLEIAKTTGENFRNALLEFNKTAPKTKEEKKDPLKEATKDYEESGKRNVELFKEGIINQQQYFAESIKILEDYLSKLKNINTKDALIILKKLTPKIGENTGYDAELEGKFQDEMRKVGETKFQNTSTNAANIGNGSLFGMFDEKTNEKINTTDNLLKKFLKDREDGFKKANEAAHQFAETMAGGITNALKNVFDAVMKGENVFKALSDAVLQFAEDIAFTILKAEILAAIQGVIAVSSGGAAGAAAGGTGFFDLLMGLMGSGQKHAAGGIVSSPQIGMIGEAGPEAIMPLSKLGSFLNTSFNAGAISSGSTGNGGQFVLRGQDLLLSVNRAQKASNLKGQNISLA